MARVWAELTDGELDSIEELDGVSNNSVIYKDNDGVYQSVSLGATGTILKSNGTTSAPDFQSGGSGNVVGPASSVDDNIATFDGITGKLIQDGGTKISELQPQDDHLDDIAALVPGVEDSLITSDGLGGWTKKTAANFITDNNILDTGDIGSTVQAYDADTAKYDMAGTFTEGQKADYWQVTENTAFASGSGAKFYKQSTLGAVLQGVTGITNDLTLITPTGITLLANPTGTNNTVLGSVGNVGIGTMSPDYKFHVNSGGTNVVAGFESTDAGAQIKLFDNSTTSGNPEIIMNRIGNNLGLMQYSGNLSVGTASDLGSKFGVVGLPTSSAGLSTGAFWNNSNVANVV